MKLKEAEHPYYCNDGNYYSNDAFIKFESWEEFLFGYGDVDIDLNLIFRWDYHIQDDGKQILQIYMIQQRKGIFRPIWVMNVKDEDEQEIRKFLQKHWEKMKENWIPISQNVSSKNSSQDFPENSQKVEGSK